MFSLTDVTVSTNPIFNPFVYVSGDRTGSLVPSQLNFFNCNWGGLFVRYGLRCIRVVVLSGKRDLNIVLPRDYNIFSLDVRVKSEG